MSTRHARPGQSERAEAARRFLAGVSRGGTAAELVADARSQHPSHNTFPGEAFLALGADALIAAGYTVGNPLAQDGLVATWLPEVSYRGRQNAKMRFAVLASAARAGGLDVDLLDEVAWWGSDDYYDYAACAALALIRGGADRLGVSVAEFAGRLAVRAGIALPRDDSPTPP